MSRFLCHVVYLLFSQFFLQRVEAISNLPRNRVVLAFKIASDHCKGITDSSHKAVRDAADEACEKAFEALDDIGANSCKGWRNAKCRLLDDLPHCQCSCTISSCNQIGIRSNEIKSFRECALEVWTEEYYYGELLPSPSFQREWMRSEYSLSTSGTLPPPFHLRDQSDFRYPHSAGSPLGTSSSGRVWYDVGSSSGHARYDVGTSSGPSWYDAVKAYVANTAGVRAKNQELEDTYCHICNRYYSTKGNLKKHFKSQHSGDEPVTSIKKFRSPRPNDFVCDTCGAPYSTVRALIAHKKSHREDITCPHCKRTLGTIGNLTRHIKQRHPLAVTGSKRKRIQEFYCFLCNKKLFSKSNLQRHIGKVHPGQESEAWGLDPDIHPGIKKSD